MVFPHYTELQNSVLSTHMVVRIYRILCNLTGGQIGALIREGVPTCKTSPSFRFRRSPPPSVAVASSSFLQVHIRLSLLERFNSSHSVGPPATHSNARFYVTQTSRYWILLCVWFLVGLH